MNHYFPDWNIIEPDLPAATQRKPLRLDQELVELLWENGHVVHNNQTHKNQGLDQNESRKVSKCNQSSNHVEGSSAENLAQENELMSWNHHHCQVDDPFEKELSSFLLPEFINSSLIHDSPIDNTYKVCNADGSQISHLLPYTSHSDNLCVNSSKPPHVQLVPNNNHSPTSNVCGFGSIGGSMKMRDVRENSGKTVGSSHCGSNQVIYDADISLTSCSGIGREIFNTTTPDEEDFAGKLASKSERSNERETIAEGSLSSGGSGFTTWNQSNGTNSSKRKNRETENSESRSEAARMKTAQESVTKRKSRASEVHNLSERRRRDRINEKMRALQELLPRSTQTDKASMLDEAIQYMKSLQLQLQMMWMGSQMAPLMFPPYMSRLEMGISPQMLPTLQSAMNLSRLPMMDQARANQAAIMNYQNQLQNCNFSDQYGAYVGFYPPPAHSANQQMNMYTSYGPNMVQQSDTLPPPGDANIRPPA